MVKRQFKPQPKKKEIDEFVSGATRPQFKQPEEPKPKPFEGIDPDNKENKKAFTIRFTHYEWAILKAAASKEMRTITSLIKATVIPAAKEITDS